MACCCWAMAFSYSVSMSMVSCSTHKCTSDSCRRWNISNIAMDVVKLISLWLWANEGLSCKFVMLRGAEYPRAVLMDDLDGATLIRTKRSYLLSLARYLSTACLGHGYFYNFVKKKKSPIPSRGSKSFAHSSFQHRRHGTTAAARAPSANGVHCLEARKELANHTAKRSHKTYVIQQAASN